MHLRWLLHGDLFLGLPHYYLTPNVCPIYPIIFFAYSPISWPFVTKRQEDGRDEGQHDLQTQSCQDAFQPWKKITASMGPTRGSHNTRQGGWLRNPAPVENGGKHSMILFGFQPSFRWCRISQPSTVSKYATALVTMRLGSMIIPTAFRFLI